MCLFQNVDSKNCTGKAIAINNSQYVSIRSNEIKGALETGVFVLNSESIKVQSNSIKLEGIQNDKIERHFVWLENSFNSIVSNNDCSNSKQYDFVNTPTIGVLNGFGDPLVNIYNNKFNV